MHQRDKQLFQTVSFVTHTQYLHPLGAQLGKDAVNPLLAQNLDFQRRGIDQLILVAFELRYRAFWREVENKGL